MRSPITFRTPGLAPLLVVCLLAAAPACHPPPLAPADDPSEVVIGERLFLETRFAQFFAANGGDDVNRPLAAGDQVVATLETTGDARAAPFAGKSMNCRACHLVDESPDPGTTGIRTYADYARRSPIPDRGDGRTHTPRNSPPRPRRASSGPSSSTDPRIRPTSAASGSSLTIVSQRTRIVVVPRPSTVAPRLMRSRAIASTSAISAAEMMAGMFR